MDPATGASARVASESKPGADGQLHPIMEPECPMPFDNVEIHRIDPIVKVSWGLEEVMSPSSEVKKEETMREQRKTKVARFEVADECEEEEDAPHPRFLPEAAEPHGGDSGDQTPTRSPLAFSQTRNRAPPPTPPSPSSPHLHSHTQLRHSLSTPTLPTFHAISNPSLVEQYTVEREADPTAFDARTAEIRRGVLRAKIERGGRARLSTGDYSVELASREDAGKAGMWRVRSDEHEDEKTGDEEAQGDEETSTLRSQPTRLTKPAVEAGSSGSVRHQHSWSTEKMSGGRERLVVMTRIEIVREVVVSKGEADVGAEESETETEALFRGLAVLAGKLKALKKAGLLQEG